MRLPSKDRDFLELYARAARQLHEATGELAAVLGVEAAQHEEIAERMREIDTATKETTFEIMRRVNRSFVTPFDRSDMHALALALAECSTHLDAALDFVVLYSLTDLPRRVVKQVDILARMADLTADVMPRLRSPKRLTEHWIEIQRLEKRAAKAYRRLLAELFNAPEPDPIAVMKHKQVVDQLRAASRSFAEVAHRLEGIAIKET